MRNEINKILEKRLNEKWFINSEQHTREAYIISTISRFLDKEKLKLNIRDYLVKHVPMPDDNNHYKVHYKDRLSQIYVIDICITKFLINELRKLKLERILHKV